MTQQCIACIRKYTDEPYELIIVDNEPTFNIYHEYDIYKPYIYEAVTPKLNVYASYNLGAKLATTDKLMFIQNDVFVHERTLNKLSIYLDKWDMCFPQQVPITRKDVLKINETPDGELTHIGGRDAGLVAITKEAFDRSGAWDERLENLLGERAFFDRCADAAVNWTDHTNAFVTHIMAATNLSKPKKLYDKEMGHDAEILNAG